MVKLGIVEYINAFPFHLPFKLGALQTNTELTYAIPSKLNALLRNKELDIALTSSLEYLEGPYKQLPGYGISAVKQIFSVNLYLKNTFKDGMRIGLTHHSATSSRLLKILCRYFWKIKPRFICLNEEKKMSECEAFLLIGDRALEQSTIPHYKTIDLAQVWYEMTALPFVFALFSMQKHIDYSSNELEAALQWSERHHSILVDHAHTQCKIPKKILNQYYNACYYRLDKKAIEGLSLFNQLKNT